MIILFKVWISFYCLDCLHALQHIITGIYWVMFFKNFYSKFLSGFDTVIFNSILNKGYIYLSFLRCPYL